MGKPSNIVLIGMPGAGKSTLGVVLAKILGFSFLDADLVIQTHMGQTLQRTIDARGPKGFLEVEGRILAGLDATRTVIATGGSAVYSEQAMQHLSDIGTVVYLEIGLPELIERIGELDGRGVVLAGNVVTPPEGSSTEGLLADVFAEREPLYRRWADLTVEVGGSSIREAALRVVEALPDGFRELQA